jgi:hypothetical protein
MKKIMIPKKNIAGDIEDVPNTTDRANTSNNDL